jgi:DNA-binding NarL/FixJ family response regulator
VEKSGPVRVFIVEDSPVIRERLTESVSSPGRIEVIGYAESEANALDALRQADWDAVILDLQLKEGNGLRVLKALRQAREGKLVIVLTNYAFPQYRVRSEQLGADYFFDKSREYHRVREVLEQRAAATHN